MTTRLRTAAAALVAAIAATVAVAAPASATPSTRSAPTTCATFSAKYMDQSRRAQDVVALANIDLARMRAGVQAGNDYIRHRKAFDAIKAEKARTAKAQRFFESMHSFGLGKERRCPTQPSHIDLPGFPLR